MEDLEISNAPVSFSDFELAEEQAIALATAPAQKYDHLLRVKFYPHAVLNAVASKEAGRKVFDERTYIQIITPANRLNVNNREATDEDKKRFSAQYKQYLAKQVQRAPGTPLDQLAALTSVQLLELQALNVETIEQLAGVPDSTIQLMGVGGPRLKREAQIYLDRTSNLETQGNRIRELERQLEELKGLIAARGEPQATVPEAKA